MRFLYLLMMSVFIFSCSSTKKIPAPPPPPPEPVTGRIVVMETNFGNMTIALSDSTPQHRDNFIKLVKRGYFDSLLFHRVIKDFMIQGGDPDSKYAKPNQRLGNGGPGYTVPAEFNDSLFHKKGMLAAAREGDGINPLKASSGSQFYIVQGKKFTDADLDRIEQMGRKGKKIPLNQREAYKTIGGSPHLDGGYTVFGEVTSGLEVIDAIAALPRDGFDRPIKDAWMRVRIVH